MNRVAVGIVVFLVAGGATALLAGGALAPEGPMDVALASAEAPAGFGAMQTDEVRRGIAAPEWRVGDAWRVMFDGGTAPCIIGVVAADETHYTQGFLCPEGSILAVQDAAYDIPHLGNFTRDLSGFHRDAPVRFFDWPLEDGKSWPLTWAGNDYEATARFVPDLEGPFGPEPGFSITAEFVGGSDTQIAYDYLPSVGWWTHITFSDAYHPWRLVAFERGYTGTLFSGQGSVRVDERSSVVPPSIMPFEVAEEDDVLLFTGTTAGLHRADIELRGPDGDARYAETRQSLGSVGYISFGDAVPAEPGHWQLEVTGVGTQSWWFRVVAVDLTEWRL